LILYTALPLERVLEGLEDLKAPEEIVFGDMTLQVEPLDHGRARVVRLISPRAEDYLNPAYAPGAIIGVPR